MRKLMLFTVCLLSLSLIFTGCSDLFGKKQNVDKNITVEKGTNEDGSKWIKETKKDSEGNVIEIKITTINTDSSKEEVTTTYDIDGKETSKKTYLTDTEGRMSYKTKYILAEPDEQGIKFTLYLPEEAKCWTTTDGAESFIGTKGVTIRFDETKYEEKEVVIIFPLVNKNDVYLFYFEHCCDDIDGNLVKSPDVFSVTAGGGKGEIDTIFDMDAWYNITPKISFNPNDSKFYLGIDTNLSSFTDIIISDSIEHSKSFVKWDLFLGDKEWKHTAWKSHNYARYDSEKQEYIVDETTEELFKLGKEIKIPYAWWSSVSLEELREYEYQFWSWIGYFFVLEDFPDLTLSVDNRGTNLEVFDPEKYYFANNEFSVNDFGMSLLFDENGKAVFKHDDGEIYKQVEFSYNFNKETGYLNLTNYKRTCISPEITVAVEHIKTYEQAYDYINSYFSSVEGAKQFVIQEHGFTDSEADNYINSLKSEALMKNMSLDQYIEFFRDVNLIDCKYYFAEKTVSEVDYKNKHLNTSFIPDTDSFSEVFNVYGIPMYLETDDDSKYAIIEHNHIEMEIDSEHCYSGYIDSVTDDKIKVVFTTGGSTKEILGKVIEQKEFSYSYDKSKCILKIYNDGYEYDLHYSEDCYPFFPE